VKIIEVMLAGSLFASTVSVADEVRVLINNEAVLDLYVTVYDLNTSDSRAVISSQRIGMSESVPIRLHADANGKAHLKWKAETAGKCGGGEKAGVSNDDRVDVDAPNSC
jgi:hypothetical protein